MARLHKKLDIGMKFLARTLYYAVLGPDGMTWFDVTLKNNIVLNTKKGNARRLIRTGTHLTEADRTGLEAFDKAHDADMHEKEAACACQTHARLRQTHARLPAAG